MEESKEGISEAAATLVAAMINMSLGKAMVNHSIMEKASIIFADFIMTHMPPKRQNMDAELDEIAIACLSQALRDELAAMAKAKQRKEN